MQEVIEGYQRAYFRLCEVLEFTGLSDRQLKYYAKTGLVVPTARICRGKFKAYTWREFFEANVVVECKGHNVSVQRLRKVMRPLREWLKGFEEQTLKAHVLLITHDLSQAFMCDSETYTVGLSKYQRPIVVAFSSIEANVRSRDARGTWARTRAVAA